VVDASAPGLGLGRAEGDLRLVSRKVRRVFVVRVTNVVAALTERHAVGGVFAVRTLEASVETQLGVHFPFRRSRQDLSGPDSFQFAEIFSFLRRRRQRDRLRFGHPSVKGRRLSL